jgi:hypothetical protein
MKEENATFFDPAPRGTPNRDTVEAMRVRSGTKKGAWSRTSHAFVDVFLPRTSASIS